MNVFTTHSLTQTEIVPIWGLVTPVMSEELPGSCGDMTRLPHVVLRFKNNYEIEKSQSRQISGGSLISVHCNITTAELKNRRRFPFFPLSMALSFRTKLARVAKDNC